MIWLQRTGLVCWFRRTHSYATGWDGFMDLHAGERKPDLVRFCRRCLARDLQPPDCDDPRGHFLTDRVGDASEMVSVESRTHDTPVSVIPLIRECERCAYRRVL